MLRKVLPYVPYIVVIISLIIAIVMVITLNDQGTSNPDQKKTTSQKDQTAGKVSGGSDPAYKVKTSPDSRPTVSAPASTPKKVASTPATSPVSTDPSKGSTELANSGPGEVVALFAASVALAAGAHSFILRRKLTP